MFYDFFLRICSSKRDKNVLGAYNSYTIVIPGDQGQLVEITGKQLRLKILIMNLLSTKDLLAKHEIINY